MKSYKYEYKYKIVTSPGVPGFESSADKTGHREELKQKAGKETQQIICCKAKTWANTNTNTKEIQQERVQKKNGKVAKNMVTQQITFRV